MALSRRLLALLILLSATSLVEPHPVLQSEMASNGSIQTSVVNKPDGMDCGGACKVRCRLSSRPNLCERACGTCCARCNCVPPGTYGNYHLCTCYATMTTKDGARKCP